MQKRKPDAADAGVQIPKIDGAPDVGSAIKRLRKDLVITQLDLAKQLGITATSVHRYEAATSVPNIDTLSKLCELAREKATPLVSLEFGRLLWSRVSPSRESDYREAAREVLNDKQKKTLLPEQRVLTMAFMRMLQESSDRTAEKVFAVLLEPWIEVIRNDPTWKDVQDTEVVPAAPLVPSSARSQATRKLKQRSRGK